MNLTWIPIVNFIHFKMKHGEFYECSNCKGLGFVHPKKEPEIPCWLNTHYAECKVCVCEVCWETGVVDWIENIAGKEKPTLNLEEEWLDNIDEELAREVVKEFLKSLATRNNSGIYGGVDDN